MNIENNVLEIGKFTYSWVRDRAQWRLFATVFLAILFTGILVMCGGLLIAASIFLPMLGVASTTGGKLAFLAGLGMVGVFIGIVLLAISLVISTFYGVRPLIVALKAKGFRTIDWTWNAALRYVWLTIVKSVYVALSLNEKKWMPLAIAFYATIVLGILMPLIWLLTVLLAFPYTILVLYNSVRLSCSYPTYLVKNTSASESISASSKLTEGKAWPIFAIYAAIMLFWMVVLGVVSFIFQTLIRIVAAIALLASLSFNSFGGALALGILSVALLFGFQFLISTFSLFTGYYLQAGIYEKVVNGDGRPSAKPAAKKQRKK
ncbi:MAG: hypothetical protein WC759_02190 [Candidatus Micrarchaeia archaeon]|jgi:hypothetical protein